MAVGVDGDFVAVTEFVAEDDIVGMAPGIADGVPVDAVIGENFLKIGESVREEKRFVGGVEEGVVDAGGSLQEIGDVEGEET